jgi:hypothetical protein
VLAAGLGRAAGGASVIAAAGGATVSGMAGGRSCHLRRCPWSQEAPDAREAFQA